MSSYTAEEKAAIIAEGHRRKVKWDFSAHDEQPAREPPPVAVEEVDPVRKWREEADAQERRFEATRAERRRQERDATRAQAQAAQPDWSAWNAWCDQRIAAALAEHHREFSELARASVAFADAVSARLRELEKLIAKLDATHAELRAHNDRRPLDMLAAATAQRELTSDQLTLAVRPASRNVPLWDEADMPGWRE
jgi:hypothetical protein